MVTCYYGDGTPVEIDLDDDLEVIVEETDADRLAEDDNTVETVEGPGGYKAFIVRDDDCQFNPLDPKEDEGIIGFIAHWHRNYLLGGAEMQSESSEDWEREARRNRYIMLPLGLLDHGGLRCFVDDGSATVMYYGWDAGQIGWVYTTPARVRELYGVKSLNGPIRRRVERELRAMVNLLDNYVQGNAYGIVITDPQGEEVDACWGFWPDYVPAGTRGDDMASIREEARSMVEGMAPSVATETSEAEGEGEDGQANTHAEGTDPTALRL